MADGVPCWADLTIGDGPDVVAYYAAVLGWSFTAGGAAGHHEAVALADGRRVGLWESDDVGPGPEWVEAASAEPGQTKTFYGAVLGHTHAPTDEPGTTTLHRDGPALGAVVFAGDALPHWLVHFAVADADAAARAAQAAGGLVVGAPAPHRAGRRAVLADPSGARFAVLSR
jgi:predicted enzyme related to lactoylglutathione lyase